MSAAASRAPSGELATNLGCVGTDCDVQGCTPASPDRIRRIEGVVELRGGAPGRPVVTVDVVAWDDGHASIP